MGVASQDAGGVETVAPFGYQLADPNKNVWSGFEKDRLPNLGPVDTFSYQVVSFKQRLLLARALGADTPDPTRNYLMAYASFTKAGAP